MGKRGHNWKARQVVETVIDDAPTKKINLDLSLKGNYDQSNELVLPSNKRKTKIKKQGENVIKILSKKQRKRLEKIVDKKDKRLQRADLLEKLSKVQATEDELRQLTSIASTQTKGLKKLFLEVEKSKADVTETGDNRPKFNSIKGAKKILPDVGVKRKYNRNDPNIVCSESSSSEDESDGDSTDLEEKTDVVEEKIELEEENNGFEVAKEKINGVGEINGKILEKKVKEVTEKEGKRKDVDVEKKPAVFVEVYRTEEIQKARLKLPILAEEQQIMEIINENDIVIVAGETGSGKTTQVPQFLYEAGYAANKIIGVTEPRRVAAISMSNRVAEEMNLTSTEVSYLIRFEGNVTESTKIKFMTDGVLLKEIKNDFLLTKYSVIILDEAHERSVYTDILIGFLSRVVPMRKKRGDPLKLIVMSATLRLSDFTENSRLFRIAPPVVNVEARQFPVTIHFNRRTPENYLLESLRKTVKIHNTLPEGGILVFVTGQKEVNFLVRKLRQMFPLKNRERIVEISKDLNKRQENSNRKRKIKIVPDINLDDYSLPGDHEIDSENSDISDFEDISEDITSKEPLWVLPLYSLLPSQKQSRIFEKPPEGCRLCVVSTNVAETSLTIPNVKYVVDTGKTKSKLYDKVTGVTSYVVTWTSKASANQRAGRAGRTAPGHCYRLYSSAVFNDVFKEFQVPEIQLKPVDDLFLQMKCMHIDKIVNFPFPTAPDLLQLKTAENRLEILGLIENSKVTDLGKTVSKFPILPRFGKMLALSHQFDLLPYTICLVAALSVQEVLTECDKSDNQEKVRLIRKKWAKTGNFLKLGDPMVLLTAVGGAEYANSQGKLEKFCMENALRQKAIIEIRKLRLQLTNEVNLNIPDLNISVDPALRPPTDTEAKLLRQILLCGMPDKIAKKIDLSGLNTEDKRKFKFAYNTENMEDPIFIHRSSVLKKDLPEFIIYQEIYETNKLYMRGITEIEPEWLAIYAPKLCNLTEPLQDPEPSFDKNTGKLKCTVTGTFGKRAFPLPNVVINFPDKPDLYKWFCKFFLEGTICKKLEKYAKNLLHPPITIVKPWAKLQPRVVKILQTVGMHRCKTRDVLLETWESNPKFLLDEYLLWLPESLHSEVVLMWPPRN